MYENVSVGFSAKFVPVKPINDEMTLCKCYVMALGKNTNRSNISKDASDDALPTLFNIPVVGHIYVDEDGVQHMGGHATKIVKGDNGKYAFKSLTVPYGTVPYQENVHYEEVNENGVAKTYLVADVILWTGRYPELISTSYSDEVFFNQSMEIKPLKTEAMKDGYTNILKYSYKALCLLGKSDDAEFNVNPCFPSARVESYDFSLEEKWDELFEEFKMKLGECYSQMSSFEKGGKTAMSKERLDEILKEFKIETVEELSFEITKDMTEEVLIEKIKENLYSQNGSENSEEPTDAVANKDEETNEFSEASNAAEETVSGENGENPSNDEEVNNVNDNSVEEFAMLANKKHNALTDAVRGFNVCEPNHKTRYYVTDYDDQYVYCGYDFDCNGAYKYGHCRFKYEEKDLEVTVDKSSYEEVEVMWLTKEEALELDKVRHEHAELVEFKEKQIEENKRREYSAVITEFSDLEDVAEYKTVVTEMLSFENAEELKEKLYAIRGKTGRLKNKKSVEEVKIPINFSKDGEESDEMKFMRKYNPEAVKNINI